MKSSIFVAAVFCLCCLTVPVQGNFNCSDGAEITTCSGRGQCDIATGQCLCNDGYISFPPEKKLNGPQCSYKQETPTLAFVLHFFIGLETGVGAFILGEDSYGAAQLVTFWVATIFGCLIGACGESSDSLALIFTSISVSSFLASTGLWITILVKIGQGDFTDSNGAPLGSW